MEAWSKLFCVIDNDQGSAEDRPEAILVLTKMRRYSIISKQEICLLSFSRS